METPQPEVAISEMIKSNENKTEIEVKSDENLDQFEGSGEDYTDDEDLIDDGHGFVWVDGEWTEKTNVTEIKTEMENKESDENKKIEEEQQSKDEELQFDQQ